MCTAASVAALEWRMCKLTPTTDFYLHCLEIESGVKVHSATLRPIHSYSAATLQVMKRETNAERISADFLLKCELQYTRISIACPTMPED